MTRAGWIAEADHIGMLVCLAWHERQIIGYVVSVWPIKITSATPIKVRPGPTPKITHFDFNIFLIFTEDFSRLIMLNNFIDSFP
jgi:hypothetical protein